MPARYDAVFFDMGLTLIDFHPSASEINRQAWQDVGLSASAEDLRAAFDAVWEGYIADAATVTFPATREYDHQDWFRRERAIMHHLGCHDEAVLMAYARRSDERYSALDAMQPYTETVPVLEALRAAGYRLAIVSNWSWNLRRRVRQVGLEDYFEVIMASAYAGCNKPHPSIFQQTLAQMGLSAERVVHVGDRYEADVAGARAAGVQALWLERTRDAVEADCPIIRDLWGVLDWLGER